MSHAHATAMRGAAAHGERSHAPHRHGKDGGGPVGVPRFLQAPAWGAEVEASPLLTLAGGQGGPLQRKCAHCEEEEKEHARVATKPASPGAAPPLTVGEPDDRFEREADATAEAVIRRMEAPATASPAQPALRRKCAECEAEERREGELGAPALRRKGRGAPGAPGGVPTSVAQGLGAGVSGAHGLPTGVRTRMGAAFSADFGSVRVHTDAAAGRMSRDLGARAFTHGRDVYFAAGQYAPETRDGGLLLAHELTHVVQQAGASVIRRAPPKPTPPPATMPAAQPSDFEMTERPRSDWTRIFFAKGSSTLRSNDRTEIGIYKLILKKSVKVVGYSSVEEAASVAQDRADAVKAELEKGSHKATVTSAVGNAGAMEKTSDLPHARSAEIIEAAGAPAVVDCKVKKNGKLVHPPTEPCTAMDPKTWSEFQGAHPVANAAMSDAVAAVTGAPSADDEALLDQFFGAHDASTLSTLRTNLGKLQTHVNRLDKITSCGGACDSGKCEKPSVIAYNDDVDAKSTMTLCVPKFKSLNRNDQARNLIHESAHGTSPLSGHAGEGTKDVAYRHERLLFHLSKADKLRNSDSYALFALFVHEARTTGKKGAVPSGIQTPASDKLDKAFGKQTPALSLALARFEKRLGWCMDDMSQLYGEMVDIRAGKQTWTASWAEDLMKKAASLFPLGAPPATPKVEDLARVAAIIDRYTRMRDGVHHRNLEVDQMAAGVITWASSGKSPVVGSTLQVGPDFFKASADDQVSLLVQHLADATRGVEKSFIPAYVALAEWIHKQNP